MKTLFFLLISLTLFAAPPTITSTMTMQQLSKLTASDAAEHDHFGRSVAISGDTVVVGAYLNDVGGISDSGASYIFKATNSSGALPAIIMYLLQ